MESTRPLLLITKSSCSLCDTRALPRLAVIFGLVDVDLLKGPTQLDFTIPFNNLREGAGKSKYKAMARRTIPSCHAALPSGSVLLARAPPPNTPAR